MLLAQQLLRARQAKARVVEGGDFHRRNIFDHCSFVVAIAASGQHSASSLLAHIIAVVGRLAGINR